MATDTNDLPARMTAVLRLRDAIAESVRQIATAFPGTTARSKRTLVHTSQWTVHVAIILEHGNARWCIDDNGTEYRVGALEDASPRQLVLIAQALPELVAKLSKEAPEIEVIERATKVAQAVNKTFKEPVS